MDDLKDQSAVSTTATNGVVESEEVRAQEALLGDTDPSLTSADDVAKALNVDPSHGLSEGRSQAPTGQIRPERGSPAPPARTEMEEIPGPIPRSAGLPADRGHYYLGDRLVHRKANAQPGAEGGEVLPFDAIVIIS